MAANHHYVSAIFALLVVVLVGVIGIFGGNLTSAAVFTGGALAPLSSEGLLSGVLVVLGLVFGYFYLRHKTSS
jgi:hypothetical protein